MPSYGVLDFERPIYKYDAPPALVATLCDPIEEARFWSANRNWQIIHFGVVPRWCSLAKTRANKKQIMWIAFAVTDYHYGE